MLPRDEAPGTGAPQRSRVDEVAKSNSTLNLFLGTRQPRWMDAAKPVGPTPRQTHSQPPQPQAAAPTGAQGDGQPGPPQARRREHIQAPHPPPEHSILPSPAPSDEATPPSNQADRETPHASPAVMQMPSQQGDAGSPPGHAAPAARFVFDPGSPDPLALPDDPSAPRNVRHASTESRTAASLPSRDEEVPGGGSAAAETAAGAGGVAAGEGAGEGAADDGQHPMTECTAQQRPANPPELLQKPAVMAPGEAATTEASKEFSDVEITGERSASRPPNDIRNTSYESAEVENAQTFLPRLDSACLPVLRALQQDPGNYEARAVTLRRCTLMKDACLRQDLLFIIIHQFYSLWALNPEEALGLVSVPRSLVDSGFQQLRSYIPESSKLHDVAKEFFAKIPLDLKEYLRASGRYQAQGSQALSMLVALSRAKNVSSVLEARKYPFLVDELLIHFRMPSMTLQELFFDQSVKTLGFSRTVHMGLITKMKDLFSADQRQHLGQKGFMEPSGYLSAEQLAVKNKDLILRYRHIYEKLQTWKPSPAPQLQPAPYSHFSQPSQQTQDQAVRQPELGMSTPQLQQHQAYQPQNQQTPNYQAVFDQGGTIRNVIGQAGEATAIAQGTNPPTDLRQGLHGDIHQRRSSNPALVPSALPLLNQMPQPSPTVLSPDSPSALQVTDGYLLQGRPINVPSARFDLRPQQMQPAPPPGMPVGVGLTSSAMAAPAQSTAAMVTPVQSPTSLGPAFGMLVPPHRQPQQNVLDANAASYLSGTTGVSGPQNLGAIFATSSAAPPMATTFAPTTAPQGQMHTPVVGQTSASMQQMQQTRQQHHMSPTPQQMQQFPQMHQVPLMPAYTGPGVARPLQSTTLIQGQGSGIQHQGMLGAQNTGAEQYQTAPRQYQNVPGHALQSPVEFSNAPAAQRPIQFVMSELNLANAQRLLNQAAQVRRGPGRPRANPATAATAQRPTSTAAQRPPQTNIQRTAASRPAPNLDRPLIPAAGQRIILQDYALDPYDRKGLMSGLHEAHLRSPERVCAQGIADTTEKRHYQSVRGFAVGPVAIPPQHAIYSLTFNVSPEQFARLSTTSVRGQFCPVRMAHYSSGSLRYRLKCCLGWPGGAVPTESEWVVSEMNWPEHIFMSIRGASDPTSKRVALQPRRKPHNSKDMPVELTTLVQPGGNIVELAVSGNGPKGDRRFFVAIEIVETLSHADALDTVMKTPPFAKAEMLKAIQDRTAASRMGGDDIAVVDEEAISIDLADPFTMKLYDIPVRGRTCTHLECFDLITWLTTRPTKPVSKACEHSGVCSCPPPAAEEPSLVDKWRCPHCLKDARPYNLQVDEFLSKVREELERTGDTKTRAILVRADGSWRSKSDDSGDAEDSGTDDDPLPPTRRKRSSTAPESTDGQNRKRRSVAAPTARPAPEVIELD